MVMAREIESLSSSNSKLRSDGDYYLYMFIEQCAGAGYLLYKIDILKHLFNKPMPDTTTQLYDDLQPLLVFPEPVLPSYFRCTKLNSTIYIIPGEDDVKFGFEGSEPTDVYMIRESDIMDIQPSEDNHGQDYLIKIASLDGVKYDPTIFVAENKLYVLSATPSSTNEFEVYSPDTDTWRVLPPRPADSYWGIVTCCVVLGKTVYFSTCPYTLQSFHLEEEKWSTIFFNPTPSVFRRDDTSFAAYPVLRPPVIIEGMAFGVLERFHTDSLTICASRLPLEDDGGDFKSSSEEKEYYLRPSIAPDEEFMHALMSSRCPHVSYKKHYCFSEYVVALDAEQVLCTISYGSGPSQNNCGSIDCHTSYATLTFFKVSPDFYLKECKQGCDDDACHHPDYASEKINGEYVATRFFNAKHQHNAHFIIKTNSLHINGLIHSCLL